MPRRFLPFFYRSLLGRLTLLVGAVLLPAALLAGWLIFHAYQNERVALERHLVGAARATALLVDGVVRERQALLEGLATSRRLAVGDLAGFRNQLLQAIRRPGEWFVLMDVHGRHLINTAAPPGEPLPQTTFGPEFDHAIAGGEHYVSNLIVGPVTGDYVLFTTIPILHDGQLRYTLSLAMKPASLNALLNSGGAERGWTVAVVDRTGVIAARNRSAAKFVGVNATAPMRAALAARSEGVLESVTLDGIRSITAFTRAAHTNWSVIVAAPSADLFVSAERLLGLGLALSVLLGLLATLLAYWIGRGVVAAVHSLVAQTEALGRGAAAPDGTTGIAEIDLVQDALAGTSGRLAAREAQLQQLNESLRSARDAAVAAGQAKDAFLAALSHELRTPLNPVLLTASDGAHHPEFPAAAREAFGVIEKNAQLEARLIDDLLDLTRIAEGKLSFHPQPVDLHAVLRDALATVQPDAEAKNLRVTLDLQAGAPSLIGDPARLQQVFWNILKNAVKFTPAGGEVLVRTHHSDQVAVVEISDNGIGMTAEEIARSFRNFSQGDHAKPGAAHRFGGLGLGLAISRALIELHRGRIHAHSAGRGQGTTLTVELPVTEPSTAVGTGPAPALAATTETRPPALRILVVEDHDPTRHALQRLLERRGHRIAVAATVAEARHLAQTEPFDLLVSDIGLPDGDGYALMQHLRGAHGLTGIALTGYGMSDDVARARAAGFVVHLTKPVDVRRLDAALAEVAPPHAPVDR